MKTMYPSTILRQFKYELEEWERLVSFMKLENVFYKSRLAEIVNTVDDDEIVEEAEEFNDDFLSQDKVMDFLTSELRKHNKSLQKDLYGDEEMFHELIRNQKKLRADVEKAEEIFAGIKKNFSGFMVTLI